MPEGVDYDTKFGHWGLGYYKRKFYEDIDKAVCYVLGKDPSKIASLVDAVNDRCKHLNSRGGDYSETFSSEFFYIRFFKKGTVHVQFKDIDVLNRLNIVAAQGRQWVGDGE